MIINSSTSTPALQANELHSSTKAAPPADINSVSIMRSDAEFAPVEETAKPRNDLNDDKQSKLDALTNKKQSEATGEKQKPANSMVEKLKEMIEQLKEQIQEVENQLGNAKSRVKGPDDMEGLAVVESITGMLNNLHSSLVTTYGLLADAMKKENSTSTSGNLIETQA